MSASMNIRGSSEEVLPAVAAAGFVGVPLAVEIAPGPAALTTDEGVISGASAAARFVSRCSGTSGSGRGSFAAAEMDSWISFAFEELMGAEVTAFMRKARPMLAALMNNGIRHSGFQKAKHAELLSLAPFRRALDALNARAEASMFLCGDACSPADVIAAAAAYDVFTLILGRGEASAAAPSARRWFDTVLVTAGLAEAAAAASVRRGGVAREGGQIDVRPDPVEVAARADDSIAANVGQRKKASQRDAEKDKKASAAAEAPAAGAGASASASGAAAPAEGEPAAVEPTAEQPESNTAEPLGREASVAKALAALEAAGLPASTYTLHEHAAVSDMEGLRAATAGTGGVLCKNFFVKAKKAKPGDKTDPRMWLIFARDETKTDMKAIAANLGYGKIVMRFGDAKTLLANLGARKGEVSPLCAMNDTALKVKVAFDASLAGETRPLILHPLTNEASLEMPLADIRRFVLSTGHAIHDVECTA